jgi:hydroxymethylbilane synthase
MKLRIGTRGSKLARSQAELAKSALCEASPELECETVLIQTRGDIDRRSRVSAGRTVGFFTKEIEDALLRDEIDVAVHSLKDLPTELPQGLEVAAIPARGDPGDALVTAEGLSLQELPAGARVLTGSPRRRAQLLNQRPDLQVKSVRGNVPTRVRKLTDGQGDALVLACAGLRRIGLEDEIGYRFDPAEFLPAPGQGALALQVRSDDDEARLICEAVNDRPTNLAATAERGFLNLLGAGCRVPAGAYGRCNPETSILQLSAMVSSLDGREMIRNSLSREVRNPDAARELGGELAGLILDAGGREILEEAIQELE